jgi:hypothetical protein
MASLMKKKPTLADLEKAVAAAQDRAEIASGALNKLHEEAAQCEMGNRPGADVASILRAKQDAMGEASAAAGALQATSFALHRAKVATAVERTGTELPKSIRRVHDHLTKIEIELAELLELATSGGLMDLYEAVPRTHPVWGDINLMTSRLDALSVYWRTQVRPYMQSA